MLHLLQLCPSKVLTAFPLQIQRFCSSHSWSCPPCCVPTRNTMTLLDYTSLSPFRMGLTNPDRALGRSCLLLISRKFLPLSGIPPFSTNSFRLASNLALLVGLNISFLTGALVWFIKITKFASFESVEVFHKDPFVAQYFSHFINDLPASLPSSVSCSLYADDLAIWSSSPSVPTAVEATQGALF